MKKDFDESIKLKMPMIILLIISLIIQPYLVRGLQSNGYTFLEIISRIFLISYYLFGFSVLINELIIRWTIVKFFNGVEIKSRIEDYSNIGLIIVSLTLFQSWVFAALTSDTDTLELSLACMLITYFVAFQDKSLIICDEIILLGFKIIKIDFVTEYKVIDFNFMQMQRKKVILTMKNGKTVEFVRDPINVDKFETYLKEKGVASKSAIS